MKQSIGVFLFTFFSWSNVHSEVIWNFDTKIDSTEIRINDDGEKNLNIQSVADLNPQIQTEPNFQISEKSKTKVQEHTESATEENLKTLDDLVQLVKAAPEIREAESNIKLSDWDIAKIKSELGPKVTLSSTGGYKIASNLDPSHRRFSSQKSSIDQSIKISKKVFDSGRSSFLIDGESIRKRAKELEYKIVYRRVYTDALLIGNNVLNILDLLDNLEQTISELKASRDDETLRYFSGTGTSTIIKELDLFAIDLINQKQLLEYRLDLEKQNFQERFNEKIDNYLFIIKSLDFNKLHSLQNFDIEKLEIVQQFELEKAAIDFTIKARKRTNFPTLDLEVNADVYDVDDGTLQQYEINGGINLNFPIFDADFIKNDISSLLSQKNIIDLKKNKKLESIQADISRLSNSDSEIEQELKAAELKIVNLEDKLRELDLRSSNIEANGLEKARTSARIRELQRNKIKLISKMTNNNIEKSKIFETILIH